MQLLVNRETHEVDVGAERTLLSVLRHEVGLTGTKYGCGEGNCGACTVLLDGEATRSCITPVASAAGREITTIEGVEGLADASALHPVQEAFIQEGAFQCAYCTPGFIVSTVALLARNPNPDREQIKAALSGHICRCGTYPRILKAVEAAAEQMAKRTERTA
ncbi:MAG: (2Fe-2S)-binding protein [Chloroflexi bacterium]|nr:(2Fe-2S)-binding protein [Chloroflexota bacterium]MCH8101674.1 (2Fe-2S)-binding protein [Chloroflexota bacterium]